MVAYEGRIVNIQPTGSDKGFELVKQNYAGQVCVYALDILITQ